MFAPHPFPPVFRTMITQRYFACEGMGFEEHEMYFHVLNGFRGLQFGGHQQHGLRWLPGECVLPLVPPHTSLRSLDFD